jgi:hypothetical protein
MPLDPVRLLGAAVLCLATAEASAFCGFYVGKADAGLFNRASQVILVRHQDRTVISMLNDYRGALNQFALVVPVPQVLQRGQIHVGDKRLFDRIDAYSSPRLAEYYDDSPCLRAEPESRRFDMAGAAAPAASARKALREVSLGSPWRPPIPSASTTLSSCRPGNPTGSKAGCGTTAIASRVAPRPRSSPTCASR